MNLRPALIPRTQFAGSRADRETNSFKETSKSGHFQEWLKRAIKRIWLQHLKHERFADEDHRAL